jgi:hypothetical protein
MCDEPIKTIDLFDVELDLLSQKMWHEVVKVIKLFLKILKTFDFRQVCNVLALLLNPWFKSLRVVKSFVGHENAICLIIENNLKKFIPFLMEFFFLRKSYY